MLDQSQNQAIERLFQEALENHENGQLKRAIQLYSEFLKVRLDSWRANYNLGLCYSILGQLDTADSALNKALKLNPEFVPTYCALGTNLTKLGDFTKAEKYLRKALELDPNHVNSHFNLAFLLLIQGKYKEGWEQYQWRLKRLDLPYSKHPSPEWEGQALDNKTLLVIAEQGMGDNLQGLRYIKRLKAESTFVALETHEPLIPLFKACKEIDLIISKKSPLPDADFHIPILSIPAVLADKEAQFSENYPYLQVDRSRYIEWSKRLGQSNKVRIGIAWQGNPAFEADKHRSIPLSEFSTLAKMPGVELISLQKGEVGTSQIKAFKQKYALTDPDENLERNRDFMDTASIMANLDLVICSDSSVAHLAGSLGIPIWLLISSTSDWRWLLDREDSPWYPSMRIFRQQEIGNWTELFSRVAIELNKQQKNLKKIKPIYKLNDDYARKDLQAWYMQAAQSYSKGDFENCKSACKKILAIEPRQIDANELLGMTYNKLKEFESAARYLRRVIFMRPNRVQALNNYGLTLYYLNRFEEAEPVLQRAIKLDSNNADAHNNLGLTLLGINEYKKAKIILQKAIKLAPENPQLYNTLGLALIALKKFDEAEKVLRKTIELLGKNIEYSPENAKTYELLDKVLFKKGETDNRIENLKKTSLAFPNNENVYITLGWLYIKLERFEEAEKIFRRLLNINPESKTAHLGIGLIHASKREYEASIISNLKAIELSPDYSEAYNNLGHVYTELKRFSEAEKCYRKAINITPLRADAHFNLACLLLGIGEYHDGWNEYRWRVHRESISIKIHNSPEWKGENLDNKSIVILSEQGHGDMIQAMRYLKRIKKTNTKIILESHELLIPLFKILPEVDHIIRRGSGLPPADFHIPIFNIPAVLQEEERDFSIENSYLKASSDTIRYWADRLGKKDKFRVGIVWQGNPNFPKDDIRSIPLSHFGTIASMPGLELISLQKEKAGTDQLEKFKKNNFIYDVDEGLEKNRDFMDTAAIMMNLDLVISSDTSVAHLAGALGLPTWVLLSSIPDWRWLTDRDDSPWYPSIRLFRQKELGNWDEVFERVRHELTKIILS